MECARGKEQIMELRASGMRMRVTPRKARLVAGEVKGKHAVLAIAQLRYHPSKGATLLRKVIESALANAVENHKRDPESLVVARINVDEGMRMKRIRARAQGRANRILKRTSHISVVLEEAEPFTIKRSNAKPKPRPKLDGGKKKPAAKKEAAEEQMEAVQVSEAAAEEVVEEQAEVAQAEEVVEEAGPEPAVEKKEGQE